ncbi:putative serine acetyltransferase 2-like, partial [Sesbania bispinosa]
SLFELGGEFNYKLKHCRMPSPVELKVFVEFSNQIAGTRSWLLGLAGKIEKGILSDHGTGVFIGETAIVGNRVSLMQLEQDMPHAINVTPAEQEAMGR